MNIKLTGSPSQISELEMDKLTEGFSLTAMLILEGISFAGEFWPLASTTDVIETELLPTWSKELTIGMLTLMGVAWPAVPIISEKLKRFWSGN